MSLEPNKPSFGVAQATSLTIPSNLTVNQPNIYHVTLGFSRLVCVCRSKYVIVTKTNVFIHTTTTVGNNRTRAKQTHKFGKTFRAIDHSTPQQRYKKQRSKLKIKDETIRHSRRRSINV